MLEIINGSLDAKEIIDRHYDENRTQNYGAIINFIGVIRDEDGIDGLSFDIYEPILNSWFEAWQKEADKRGAKVLMAHSKGDVLLHESSFIATILSPKRRVALELIDEFVEDFKKNAPIWKYDLRDGARIYAKDRSQAIDGAGILGK